MPKSMENKKPENSDNIFKTEKYEVVLPLNTNSDKIFDTVNFEIKIWRDEDIKFVFVKKKK